MAISVGGAIRDSIMPRAAIVARFTRQPVSAIGSRNWAQPNEINGGGSDLDICQVGSGTAEVPAG